MTNKVFRELLQSVIMHWEESAKAYADYMQNGKKFSDAQRLKLHNTYVKDQLSNNITLIPDDLKSDVEAIIEHYTIWSAKWDELKEKINPGPDDEFVFENAHRFPKQAAQRLEVVFNELS